jgi:hypothetical protein
MAFSLQAFDGRNEIQPEKVHGQVDCPAATFLYPAVVPLWAGYQQFDHATTDRNINPFGLIVLHWLEIRVRFPIQP